MTYLKNNILNLTSLKSVFCSHCNERKNNVSCCLDPLDPHLCSYIKSLNFAIKMLNAVDKEIH